MKKILFVFLFVVSVLVGCSAHVPALNADQYSWRIEGLMERISEKEDELRDLYDEYWEALQVQRELYLQENQ